MILVTGANSLLGTNTVLALLERGYRVRALVRRSNEVLDRVEVVRGDVNSEQDLRGAMRGCRAVVHIAAITAQDLLSLEDYSFNWECAVRVARMAREMGLERMIFVSSSNTVGNGTLREPAKEGQAVARPYLGSLYTMSKVRAEREVVQAFERVVIVNPGFMIGAYDSKPSSGAIITRALGRGLVFVPNGGKSFVDVEDVAQAIVGALERGRFGERYLATGVSMSVREFYGVMMRVTGRRFVVVMVPSVLLIGVGYLGNLVRWLGVKSPLTSDNMRILCGMEYYDSEKARVELGMEQRPIEGAIKKAIEYFKQKRG